MTESLKILFCYKVLVLCTFINLYPSLCSSQNLEWKEFGKLHLARHYFGALAFSQDEILVMGGYINSRGALTGDITNTCEIINTANRVIFSSSPMNLARAESVFLLTADSNIVAISGVHGRIGSTVTLTPTCELYSKTTKTWKILGSLNISRRQHIASFINKEEILVVGGRDSTVNTTARAEIFNIRTGQSHFVQDFPYPINLGVAAISSKNKTLFFGGRSGGANSFRTTDVHEYDTLRNRWTVATQIREGIHGPNLLKLWDSRLLVGGGSKNEEPITFSASTTIENYPQFTHIATIQARHWHTMAQWSKDSIAIIGGINPQNYQNLQSVEWIDIKQGRSFQAPSLREPRGRFVSISMPKFDKQGKQIHSSIFAISGLLGDEIFNTPTIEILESTTSPQLSQPLSSLTTIQSRVQETSSATAFVVTLMASTGTLTNIVPELSSNLTFFTITQMPSGIVQGIIQIINPSIPAILSSIRITDNQSRTQIIPLNITVIARQ